mgnify:CR=1 FL=1
MSSSLPPRPPGRRVLRAALFGGLAAGACSPIIDVTIPEDYVAGSPDAGPGDAGAAECVAAVDCGSAERFECVDGACVDLETVDPCADPGRRVLVSRFIRADQEWTPDRCYLLAEPTFVVSATLRIRRGTRILGASADSALISTRTGRIEARGSARYPVVFTSANPPGSRLPSDWGGVALLGDAPLNVPGGVDLLEGVDPPEGESGALIEYGGQSPDDNCGFLRYVRIEFAGFARGEGDELNGLTLAGCGSATGIDFVQVHFGSDDGVEVFGGTVGMSRVVISRAQDDSLDWDQGWTGWAQYLVILQDGPRTEVAAVFEGGDNGFEADSLGDDAIGDPRSRPRLYNVTMIGSQAPGARSRAMLFKEGTSVEMRNLVVARYARGLWDIEDPITAECFDPGRRGRGACTGTTAFAQDGMALSDLGSMGSLVEMDDDGRDGGFDELGLVNTLIAEGTAFVVDTSTTAHLVQPFLELVGPGTPLDLRPRAGSPLLGRATSYPSPPDGVVGGEDFLGALPGVGETDWTKPWTAFPED